MSSTKSVAVDIEQTSTVYVTLNYSLLNMHPPTPGVPIHFNTEKEEPDVAAKESKSSKKELPDQDVENHSVHVWDCVGDALFCFF